MEELSRGGVWIFEYPQKNKKIFCFQNFTFGSLNAWQLDRLKKRKRKWVYLTEKGQSGTLSKHEGRLKIGASCKLQPAVS